MDNLFKTSILLSLAFCCACTASIKPIQPFAPADDAAVLCKALQDKQHINTGNIIQILTSRSYNQRKEIIDTFSKTCTKKKLKTQLKKNLSGVFGNVIDALLTPLPEFYVREMMRESSTKVRHTNAILDILTTSSDKEIDAYKKLRHSKKPLHKVLKNPYREKDPELDFVVDFITANRTNCKKAMETTRFGPFNAVKAAKWFHAVGDNKNAMTRVRGDERQTVLILRQWSIEELRAVIKAYEELYHHDFEKAFEQRGFADDIEQGALTMIRVIKSTPLYFADRLYDSLRGSKGPNDRVLIRIIVGRSEIDLDDISKEFEKKYGRSLISVIETKDRDKDYLRTLTSIIGHGNKDAN